MLEAKNIKISNNLDFVKILLLFFSKKLCQKKSMKIIISKICADLSVPCSAIL